MGLKTAKYKAHQRVLYLFVFYLQKNKCVKWGAVLLSEGNEEGSVGAGFLEPWTSQKLFCRAKVLIWGTLISVANPFPHFQYIQIHYEAVLGIFFYFLYCSTVCFLSMLSTIALIKEASWVVLIVIGLVSPYCFFKKSFPNFYGLIIFFIRNLNSVYQYFKVKETSWFYYWIHIKFIQ